MFYVTYLDIRQVNILKVFIFYSVFGNFYLKLFRNHRERVTLLTLFFFHVLQI